MDKDKTVILGVAESDCHVVANQLIEHMLRIKGYQVINLGACTSVYEFAHAYENHPDCLAILIGSLNGHGYGDLRGLKQVIKRYEIRCPIILGGNLSVGCKKTEEHTNRFYEIGVDYILDDAKEIPKFLESLRQKAMIHHQPTSYLFAMNSRNLRSSVPLQIEMIEA